ncbi:MAG: hypothetical protein KKD31_05690 [Bacteroidetes bacterium]|nr:hypothetical protein [Bacteroidota bacterium]
MKIVLAAGAVIGGSKLLAAVKAKNVTDEMNINLVNPRIHKIDANPLTGGIEIRTQVQLQNPTKGKLAITQPFVQILHKGSSIVSSSVQNKQYTVQPLSELTLDTISMKIGWMKLIELITSAEYGVPKEYSLLNKVTWFIANYKTVLAKMKLDMKYSTYANGLFYTKTEKIASE